MKYTPYIFLIIVLAYACETVYTETVIDPELPPNPYDDLVFPEPTDNSATIDSTSFAGLHYFIFSKRCNQPACHDGTFEPDFRTIESAYNSLVYHPVKKNTANNDYPYRITPGDPSKSMLYRRITVHDPPNLERMPSSGTPLGAAEIDAIHQWIVDGAKDVYGNSPTLASLQPTCYGVAAFLPNSNDYRLDTARGAFLFNPFPVPVNQDVEFWFLYVDVTPAGDTVLGNNLTYNRIAFSTNPYDFSNAVELNMTIGVKLINGFFSQQAGPLLPYYQNITLKLSDHGFSAGETVYIRTYVQDSDHTTPTEIPKSDSQFAIQSYFSMTLF